MKALHVATRFAAARGVAVGVALSVLMAVIGGSPSSQTKPRRLAEMAEAPLAPAEAESPQSRSSTSVSEPTVVREPGVAQHIAPAPLTPLAPLAPEPAKLPRGAVIAAPNGAKAGDGSVSRPLDLASALSADGPVDAGDTLLLRGGVYSGAFTSNLAGTRSEPITIRSYPGEWAVLDGGSLKAATIHIVGPDTHVRDLEVMKSDPDRVSEYPTNRPPDLSRSTWAGVSVDGARAKLINLVVHDNGDGIGLWRHAVDSEVYGCVIYNNGWLGSDHAWGHGIYIQNSSGTKRIENNVVFNNFGWGVHAFDEVRELNGVVVDKVTSFNNGAPAGAHVPNVVGGAQRERADRITLTNSVLYHRPGVIGVNLALGHVRASGANGAVAVQGNTIVGGSRAILLRDWERAQVSGNTVAIAPTDENAKTGLAEIVPVSDLARTNYSWNDNVYHDANAAQSGSAKSFMVGAMNRRALTFADWRRETYFDSRTTYVHNAPEGMVATVRANRYESGRAFLTVLNWPKASAVAVDLSDARLAVGQRFAIYDVQNLGGEPLVTDTYRGKHVSVPMGSSAVSSPVGDEPDPVRHTGRDFGAFLVVLLPPVSAS